MEDKRRHTPFRSFAEKIEQFWTGVTIRVEHLSHPRARCFTIEPAESCCKQTELAKIARQVRFSIASLAINTPVKEFSRSSRTGTAEPVTQALSSIAFYSELAAASSGQRLIVTAALSSDRKSTRLNSSHS